MVVTRTISIVAIAAVAVVMLGASIAPAANANPNSAFIKKGFGCNIPDGNGGFAFTDNHNNIIVQTNSKTGRVNAVCHADNVPNSAGKAVVMSGFDCVIFIPETGFFTVTTDTKATISASGQATLTCKS
jgi:hypothetical protein